MSKVVVPYEHHPEDLGAVYLAVTSAPKRPDGDAWRPALRDVVEGRRVVWVRVPDGPRSVVVWLRDRDGVRVVKPL